MEIGEGVHIYSNVNQNEHDKQVKRKQITDLHIL